MSAPCPFTRAVLAHQPPRAQTLPLVDDPTPNMVRSSPQVVSLDWVEESLGWSDRRRTLLAAFRDHLAALRARGAEPICAMIGGSLLGPKESPKDLDGLVAYRAGAQGLTAEARALMMRGAAQDLDLRFVPEDGGALLIMKMSAFFHTLYQGFDKGLHQASVLVPLAAPDDEAEAVRSFEPAP